MKVTSKGVKNFTAAAKRAAKAIMSGDSVLVDDSTRQKRVSICEACEYQTSMQCSVCECLIVAKTMLRTENCPQGKW